MNNTITTLFGAAILFALDHMHASPWLAVPLAFVAVGLGYVVARKLSRRWQNVR